MAAFQFIGSDHPFFPQIASLREAIAKGPEKAAGENTSTRSLLRLDFSGPSPKLKWMYVSRQTWTSEPRRFEAITYLHRADRMRVDRYEFPRDPKLNGLAPVLNEFRNDWNVLRYVPRRRLTVYTGDWIAKFVRATELTETIARLKMVEGIIAGNAGFIASKVGEARQENGVFFQNIVPGASLPSLIDSSSFLSFVKTAGNVSRRIHQRSHSGIPRMEPDSVLTMTKRDEAMLATFRGDLKNWLASVVKTLSQGLQSCKDETVFCHGDFRAPHLLVNNTGDWGVVDFDGAVAADPHWEHALFITSLKRELAMFADAGLHEQAADAYRAGYEQEGGRVNREKLRWYRLAAEIHFLARSFQRDLYTPRLFAQSVCAIGKLSGVGTP